VHKKRGGGPDPDNVGVMKQVIWAMDEGIFCYRASVRSETGSV
jgi:hypothetical protein